MSASEALPWLFPAAALASAIGVPAYVRRVRGRSFGIYGGVILGIALPGALATHLRLRPLVPDPATPVFDLAFAWCMAAAALHLAHLARPRLRSRVFRLAVSVPGQAFLAAGALSGLWLVALLPLRGLLMLLGMHAALDAMRGLDALPLLAAGVSVFTSTWPRTEWVRIRLDRSRSEPGPVHAVERVPVARTRRPPPPLAERSLRIVQITDPHLGPWQSAARLERRVVALVAHDPDLVLLTGDFLTMESRGTPGALARAFTPLRSLPGRCFAIFGNHDHEAPDEVRAGLEANGVRLLVDAEACVETPAGPVQIVGADWVREGQRAHIEKLMANHPRRTGHLRLLLLHDPQGFRFVPAGDVDLTLSGHTHGGQIGLVSLGFDWTVLSRSRWPDHGLFGCGSNRLYVHRGTGFYGFPLRVGVPGEASLLELISSDAPVQRAS